MLSISLSVSCGSIASREEEHYVDALAISTQRNWLHQHSAIGFADNFISNYLRSKGAIQ